MEKKQSGLFSDKIGAVLTDKEIAGAVADGELISSEGYSLDCLQASSYDFRVGNKAIIGGEGVEIDLTEGNLHLQPGTYAGVLSLEKLQLPATVSARISSKRALSYDGIILLTGGIVDPGYSGYLLFGLYNASHKKVVIPHKKKICNVVFERLADRPERTAQSDAQLRKGDFPESFVEKMVNMEVLPWMQMSERVKQIEHITKDIIDLKARYDDVLKPIRELTGNVEKLTLNVDRVDKLVEENSRHIGQLSTAVTKLTEQSHSTQDSTRKTADKVDDLRKDHLELRSSFGRFRLVWSVIGAVLLVLLGAYIKDIIAFIATIAKAA